jgi:hypothetical protein
VTSPEARGVESKGARDPRSRRRVAWTEPSVLAPEAKLRAADRQRYRLRPLPSRWAGPDGADVVAVLMTPRGVVKRLVLASWPVSVPAEVRCLLPPLPRRAVYGAAAREWARGQLRASRRAGGKRLGWSTERNLRKVVRGEHPLMRDLWDRVHAWLRPPQPSGPLVAFRVQLFGGPPTIARAHGAQGKSHPLRG